MNTCLCDKALIRADGDRIRTLNRARFGSTALDEHACRPSSPPANGTR